LGSEGGAALEGAPHLKYEYMIIFIIMEAPESKIQQLHELIHKAGVIHARDLTFLQ
jgi:hypothetical protein